MVDEYLTGGGEVRTPRPGWYLIKRGQFFIISDTETCELLVKEHKILPFFSGGDCEKLSLNSFEDFIINVFSDGSFIIYR